jgi:hypothetical protein
MKDKYSKEIKNSLDCCKNPTNMLKYMKADEENYYYSVPRPYRHMIGQAEEINKEIA